MFDDIICVVCGMLNENRIDSHVTLIVHGVCVISASFLVGLFIGTNCPLCPNAYNSKTFLSLNDELIHLSTKYSLQEIHFFFFFFYKIIR